ncbi:hypothetical protein [Prauserella rugosa]|uniref:Uncharacterized protein n=1 Tax=Prauserella rugosa TaxID=43354 RepID=A0A660CCG8_9PSEU|nr:hypothetical protein [Prauserella rugosa]KID31638.1 hypothetical protein HQ32_01459 [Prauserella sp. Am3]KMS87495.1 hypothetical protein ACZ91_31055 [Streptomyces regensis]TWH19453.1 hypothetical protein JD82_01278 [Prauserella rugosa]
MDPVIVIGAMAGALVAAGVMFLVATTRKGSVASIAMTKRRIVLWSSAPPEALYAWVTQYCPQGYRLEDADPASGRFVVSSRPSFATWGFFFPGVVYADPAGSRLELGITSRAVQWGPLVGREHRKLAQELATLTGSRLAEA